MPALMEEKNDHIGGRQRSTEPHQSQVIVPPLREMELEEEIGCPRGINKMERRALSWLAFAKRRRLLTLGALPPKLAPRSTREAIGYFLYVNRVEGWQIPAGLLTKVASSKTELRYSLSITFYHTISKRFFGSTVMGQQVEGLNMKELLKKGEDTNAALPAKAPPAPVALNVTHDEIMYWYSRVADQDCMAVIELVASEIEPTYGVTLNQYACGWTMLRPFGNQSLKDSAEDDPESKVTFETLPVYRGTPRQLLFFSDQDWVNLKQRVIPGCTIQFKLRQFHKLLRAMHLFRENEVMSAIDILPGLENSAVKLPNGNKMGQAAILGADIVWRGRKHDGATPVVSPAKPLLAPIYSVQLHDIQILVPGRADLERELLVSVVSELPNLAKEVPTNRSFSMSMSMTLSSTRRSSMALVEDIAPKDRKATILSRFLKVGLHNGRCLVRQHDDEPWLYLKLDDFDDDEEGGDSDLLSHLSPKDFKLINFFKHRFCALVFMLEYSVRIGAKKGRGSGGSNSAAQEAGTSSRGLGGRDEMKESRAKEEAAARAASAVVKVPIVLGGQAYCPFDGKRLRLRNMPRKSDPSIELDLLPDEHCRILTNDLVFTPARTQLLLKTMRTEDPMILGLNITVRDSKGLVQTDETPVTDAMESESETEERGKEKGEEKDQEEDDDEASSSEGEVEENEQSDSSRSSSRETEPTEGLTTERSDLTISASEASYAIKKPSKKHHHRKEKEKHKSKRRYHKNEVSEAGTEEYQPSLIGGDSYSSYLRKRASHRNRYKNLRPPSDLSEFEEWRSGIHVPNDKQSLLAQSLQVTLKGPLKAEAEQPSSAPPLEQEPKEPRIVYPGTRTVDKRASSKFSPELTRASRARLGRYGFQDIMREGSGAVVLPPDQRDIVSIDTELMDELSRHEITIQFAAFRVARAEDKPRVPDNLYFTFQFYKYAPTKTEKSLLREDSLGDKLTSILVRESQYGRDAPAKAYRFVIDTGSMQETEARNFVEYMASSSLHVDVWDADSLLLVGSLSIPLWRLMRQGNPVSKIAHEYEVTSPVDGRDHNHGSITVGVGGHAGPIFGFIQLLACNYGEKTENARPPPPSIESPLLSFHHHVDWRLRYQREREGGSLLATDSTSAKHQHQRPGRRVRARPLSESNSEAASLLEQNRLRPKGGNLGREGTAFRAAADDRSITYDELLLLFKRFRGPGKSLISYRDRLLDLLCVASVQALESKFLKLVTRAEENGASLEEIFRYFDKNKDGSITLNELEEGLRKVEGMKRLRPVEIRMLLKRFENKVGVASTSKQGGSSSSSSSSRIDLRKFIQFIRSRQPCTNVEIRFKRILAKADLAGINLDQAFTKFGNVTNDHEITVDAFKRCLASLGSLASGLKATEMEKLLRKLDSHGSGRVALEAIARIRGVPYQSTAGKVSPPADAMVNEKLKNIIHRAQEDGLSVEYAFKHFDKEGTGLLSEAEFEQGLRQLGVFRESDDILHAAIHAWKKDSSNTVSWKDFIRWAGEKEPVAEEMLEEKLIKLFIKAQDIGLSLQAAMDNFDPVKTGSISLEGFTAGLQKLERSHSITNEEAKQLFIRWSKGGTDNKAADSSKLERKALQSLIGEKMEVIRKRSKASKRQITLAHLRDAAVRVLNKAKEGEVISPKKLFDNVKKRGDENDLIASTDFESVLSTSRLLPPPIGGGHEGAPPLLKAQDVIAAFSSGAAGGKDNVVISLKSFTEWWNQTVIPAQKLSSSTKKPVVAAAIADPKAQGKEGGDGNKKIEGEKGSDLSGGLSAALAASEKEDSKASDKRGAKGEKEGDDGGRKGDEGSKEEKGGSSSSQHQPHRKTAAIDSDDEDDVSAEFYEYSKDIVTKEVEKKLRRAARSILRQGIDIESLFKDLDPDGTGNIQRADLITLIMEMNLSLVDGPGFSYAQGQKAVPEGGKIRERQLAQVAAIHGHSAVHGAGRVLSSKGKIENQPPLHLFTHMNIDPSAGNYEKQAVDSEESLALIKLYRENQKRHAIRDMLLQSMRTTYRIFPRVGDMDFFEFPFQNPFPHEERFKIIVADPACELRVVQSSEEWSYLRQNKRPAVGEIWPMPIVERDMMDNGGQEGVQLALNANEELPIPFSFITVAPTSDTTTTANPASEKGKNSKTSGWNEAARTVEVCFVSASHGNVVAQLRVEVLVQPLTVGRVLRFYQGEREIMRRCVRFLPGHTSTAALDEGQDTTKYVHCLEPNQNGKKNVVVEWRQVDGMMEEVLIKHLCGPFPAVGTFYLLIYNDHFQAILHEVWRVEIHSRLNANVHSFLGQSVSLDLMLNGDRFVRRVNLFSSSPTSISFEPSAKTKLPAGGETPIRLKYRPTVVGQEQIHVHVVDADTSELISAWLLNTTSNPPIVTKTYDVDIPVGRPGHKKIAYINPWDKPRFYELVSSDDNIMRARYSRLEIPAQEKAYIRLYFPAQSEVGTRKEVFLFMNDSKGDQNEECFLVRMRVTEV